MQVCPNKFLREIPVELLETRSQEVQTDAIVEVDEQEGGEEEPETISDEEEEEAATASLSLHGDPVMLHGSCL